MKLHISLVVLLQIPGLLAIRCYSCVGQFGRKGQSEDPCVNPAKNVGDGNIQEIDCSNTKLCWKAITAGQLKRGCGEKRCAFIPDINIGSVVTQTCCTNDLCNRTSAMVFSTWLIISLICSTVLLQSNY